MDVDFRNSLGLKLAGVLEFPSVDKNKYSAVVFSHGFRSGKDSPRGKVVAEKLRGREIASFLIDFTGHGDSEGRIMDDSTIERQTDDLSHAIDFIERQQKVDRDAIGVTGASSGGLVAIRQLLRDNRIKALVLRGPRVDDMISHAKEISVPTLILAGEFDPLIKDAETFFAELECEKGMEIISGSGHLFETKDMLDHVARATADWFHKYLISEPAEKRSAA